MKNLVWFLFGIVGGFALAHLVDKNPRGHELLELVDARIGEFTDRIGTAYRDQEAHFADLVDDAKVAAAAAAVTVKDVAADAVGAAKDAVAAASDAVSGTKTSD